METLDPHAPSPNPLQLNVGLWPKNSEEAGDLLLIDTAAWYHATEIPAFTDFSFSLAQDALLGSGMVFLHWNPCGIQSSIPNLRYAQQMFG